jgi:hypothetical protein
VMQSIGRMQGHVRARWLRPARVDDNRSVRGAMSLLGVSA